MASSGIPALDQLLGGAGYPDKSVILVVGPPGIGKEALVYKFMSSGISQGEFCLYATKRSVGEVQKDSSAFGFAGGLKPTRWIASQGSEVKFDVDNLAEISHDIKEALRENGSNRIRLVLDALSSILMLNPPETVYRFLAQLFKEVKQYDATLLATLEEGMHSTQVGAAMAELFDGVVEVKVFEDGMRLMPILRIRKMLGTAPQPTYYDFAYSRTAGLEISPHVKQSLHGFPS